MSTLQIRKLESGTFDHVDSIDGKFFLGRFNFKEEFGKAFLVEAYGAKRREYVIEAISVYDYLGAEELFTNFTDLINRLTELGYTGIETNGIIPTASSYISSDVDNAIVLGTDSKLFVPETTGGIESVVAGTNITIDNTDPLNPVISASGGGGGTTDTIAQASWEDNIFNASNQVVGSLNGYAANGGNINNGIASPNIDDYMNFLCFSSGTSANGGYRYLQISPVGGSSFKPQAGLTCFGTFCIYSNSSADTLIRFGFNSSSNLPTDAQFGAYIEITGSSIVGKTANNNVRSTTTSGALTYSTAQGSEIPYHFMIHFDTLTQVTFKVVKHDGTVVLNTSLNTNTPPAAARFYASAMGCIQTAGTNRNILGLSRLGFGVQKPNFLNSF